MQRRNFFKLKIIKPLSWHFSAGAGRAGIFIALSILLERMRFEGMVDFLLTTHLLRSQRSNMIEEESRYAILLHRLCTPPSWNSEPLSSQLTFSIPNTPRPHLPSCPQLHSYPHYPHKVPPIYVLLPLSHSHSLLT
nr:Ptprd protein [Hymenolepis microstoma]